MPRIRLVFSAALVAAAAAGLAGRASLAAQERPAEAVLLSGPTAVKGIPVYAPNRIPAFRGTYSLDSAEQGQERILTILYSR